MSLDGHRTRFYICRARAALALLKFATLRMTREKLQVPALGQSTGADHLVYKGVQTLSSGGSLILYWN